MSNIRDRLPPFVREYSPLLFLSIAAFLLTRYSITYGAGSDPRYTLIVTQSLIENGTIQLNAYQNDEIWGAPADLDNDPNILNIDGRYYNYFPAGPSLLRRRKYGAEGRVTAVKHTLRALGQYGRVAIDTLYFTWERYRRLRRQNYSTSLFNRLEVEA